MVSTLCSRAKATSTLLSSSTLRRSLPLVGAVFCVLKFSLSNLCLSSTLLSHHHHNPQHIHHNNPQTISATLCTHNPATTTHHPSQPSTATHKSSHPWSISHPNPTNQQTHLAIKEKQSKLRTCGWANDSWGGQEMVELTTVMDEKKRKTQVELVIVELVMGAWCQRREESVRARDETRIWTLGGSLKLFYLFIYFYENKN